MSLQLYYYCNQSVATFFNEQVREFTDDSEFFKLRTIFRVFLPTIFAPKI